MRDRPERKDIVAQITRKDVDRYRDDQEELEAWRITERRRQEEAFLQRIRDEAAGLGRHLKSTPQWVQAIKKVRSEVLHTLATNTFRRGETVTVTTPLSDMSWRWRMRWNRWIGGCGWAYREGVSPAIAKGLLNGGLRACLETILPVAHAGCYESKSMSSWVLTVEFWPPKD